MKLICERDALSRALHHVAGRARNKHKIPILTHVKIVAADSRLTLTANDLASQSQSVCSAEIAEAGATTAPVDRLLALVDGLAKGAQIEMNLRQNDLHVRCGSSRYRLPTLPAAEFPEMAEPVNPIEFSLPCLDARALFGEPAPACEVSGGRIMLEGGCLHQPAPGTLEVVALDGKRLISRSIAAGIRFDRRPIIPKAAMAEIVRLAADGEVQFAVGSDLIAVTAGNCTFTSKLIEATYPDVDSFMTKPQAQFILVDRAELAAALKRLAGLTGEHSTFNIAWSEGDLNISLSGEGHGSETLQCECDMVPGLIAFAPNILMPMLEAHKGDVIQLHIVAPNKGMLILNPADEGLTVMAMPCAPKNANADKEAA
jgi:DNA polymerase-3 subunit beta